MNDCKQFMGRYQSVTPVHNYIEGFAYMGKIYGLFSTAKDLVEALSIDRASQKNGGHKTLKYTPKTAYKKAHIDNAIYLMDEKDFLEMVKNSKYNRGEIFEKIITERFGQKWKKDNVPFYKGGDININGTEYQIKYQKATFCSEKQLEKLGK